MDLGNLYQDVILEHNRNPRNWGELEPPSRRADGRNPMCGDEVTVWLKVEGDRLADVSFVGTGCAISKASASMMTQAVKGKTRAEAEEVFAQFHAMVTGAARGEPSGADVARQAQGLLRSGALSPPA